MLKPESYWLFWNVIGLPGSTKGRPRSCTPTAEQLAGGSRHEQRRVEDAAVEKVHAEEDQKPLPNQNVAPAKVVQDGLARALAVACGIGARPKLVPRNTYI
jgi:hypothetical protein